MSFKKSLEESDKSISSFQFHKNFKFSDFFVKLLTEKKFIDTDDTNTFEMDIESSMTLRKKLLSVAHEMVHVKQFTRGELKHTDTLTAKRWLGKTYNESNYWDCPWEIEAYGRELGLFTMWVEKLDIKGKFTEDPT